MKNAQAGRRAKRNEREKNGKTIRNELEIVRDSQS